MKKILIPFSLLVAVAILSFVYPSSSRAVGYGAEQVEPDSSGKKFLNWYNASADSLEIQGAQVDKAYREILNSKKSRTIIVAVIDGGVDIKHEDLKENIWTNEKEIEGNGKDDDFNGFTDDLHGWNFLGNEKGENITYENYELTRIVRKYDGRFRDKKPDDIPESEKAAFGLYRSARAEFDEKLKKYKEEKEKIDLIYKGYYSALANLKEYMGKETITLNEIRSINPQQEMLKKSRDYLLYLDNIGYTKEDLEEIKENNYNHLFFHLNLEYNPRSLVGDNPEIQELKPYGNNDVAGDRAEHGTFVSGIIAGIRNNNKGINGIASDVKIMSLRVVPDGDERDKDVANAIFYAISNGARVINCSFGKNYSTERHMIDSALLAAKKHGVLIVHAAGNDAQDCDEVAHFPTGKLSTGESLDDNWITVGASSMFADKNLPGKFSNYGQKNVDLFAPGVDMYSLHPADGYDTGNGTSFSAPVVSGIAALLLSYYPDLTPAELKKIILGSVSRHPKLKVFLPTKKDKQKKKVRFSKLSQSGGLVNAYEAVKMAEALQKSKKGL